ncbi:MAG: multidrug effflux MFS transporter [Rhodospirillales bacterium]|nr:multidrug effflux MFS transporter [Rhodospirillales bacterium]
MLKPETLPFAALLTALTAFGPLATDMYLPSLPAMAADFATDVGTVQLTLSVFMAGFGISQLMVGPLSDRFGRRPVLIVGVGLYFLATAACALAPTIELLIGLRFVQAIGACTGVVVARAVVRDVYGRDRAAKVLAYMGTAMALAPVIAPIIGGYLVMWSGWRSIFVALAIFGLILVLLVWRQLGETNQYKDVMATRPSWLARNYLTLLGDRSYLGYVLVNTFVFCGMFAFISGSSFVLIKFLGLPPNLFGMCFGIAVLGYMSGTVIAGKLTVRIGIDGMLAAGGVVAMVGGVTMVGLALAGVDHAAAVIGPQFTYMIGMGIVMPNAIAGAIGPYPKMAGAASALLGFVQMAAAALVGLAVGQLDDGTQIPMTTAIAASGTLTFIAYRVMIRPNLRP